MARCSSGELCGCSDDVPAAEGPAGSCHPDHPDHEPLPDQELLHQSGACHQEEHPDCDSDMLRGGRVWAGACLQVCLGNIRKGRFYATWNSSASTALPQQRQGHRAISGAAVPAAVTAAIQQLQWRQHHRSTGCSDGSTTVSAGAAVAAAPAPMVATEKLSLTSSLSGQDGSIQNSKTYGCNSSNSYEDLWCKDSAGMKTATTGTWSVRPCAVVAPGSRVPLDYCYYHTCYDKLLERLRTLSTDCRSCCYLVLRLRQWRPQGLASKHLRSGTTAWKLLLLSASSLLCRRFCWPPLCCAAGHATATCLVQSACA